MKDVIWVGSSKKDLREFSKEVREDTGHQIWRVQGGNDPDDWKPISSVGKGVREIRVHSDGEHRVFYVALFEEGVYILHCFVKKTQKTPKKDIVLGRQRYKLVLKSRRKAT